MKERKLCGAALNKLQDILTLPAILPYEISATSRGGVEFILDVNTTTIIHGSIVDTSGYYYTRGFALISNEGVLVNTWHLCDMVQTKINNDLLKTDLDEGDTYDLYEAFAGHGSNESIIVTQLGCGTWTCGAKVYAGVMPQEEHLESGTYIASPTGTRYRVSNDAHVKPLLGKIWGGVFYKPRAAMMSDNASPLVEKVRIRRRQRRKIVDGIVGVDGAGAPMQDTTDVAEAMERILDIHGPALKPSTDALVAVDPLGKLIKTTDTFHDKICRMLAMVSDTMNSAPVPHSMRRSWPADEPIADSRKAYVYDPHKDTMDIIIAHMKSLQLMDKMISEGIRHGIDVKPLAESAVNLRRHIESLWAQRCTINKH